MLTLPYIQIDPASCIRYASLVRSHALLAESLILVSSTGQQTCQEARQEVRRFPDLRGPHQADPASPWPGSVEGCVECGCPGRHQANSTLPPAGKFPTPVSHAEDLSNKLTEVRSTIKFQLKKVLCLGVAVGHVQMTEDQVLGNIMLSASQVLYALLPCDLPSFPSPQASTSWSPCSRRTGKTSSRCTSRRPWASPSACSKRCAPW